MLTAKQHQQRVNAGSKGGNAVLEKYGSEHFSALSQSRRIKRGRPTFFEALEQARAAERASKEASRPGRPKTS